MGMTPNGYKQFRKDGESHQTTQREENRRLNIDIIERQKDREIQNNIFLVSIIAVIVTIIIFLFKNQVFKQVERLTSAKLNNGQTCNYLNINDDGTILKNKFDYYKFPNAQPKEQVPIDLQEFLVSYYVSIDFYGYSCYEKKPTCSKDNSEFQLTSLDLNSDGKKEYIVMPWKVCDCSMRGASGGGDILILREEDNKYEIIGNLSKGNISNSNGYVISKNKTNGYYDILANSHSSVATGDEALYKYQIFSNGGKTKGKYEFAFSKWYDFTRVNKKY